MSLKRRLLISVLAIFGISAAMFAATWIITSAQKADGLGINLAGRQRMLVQKMTKEAVAYVHDLKEGRKNEALAGTIQSQMDGFEANLQALIAGGQVSGAGARISVPPASNLIAAQLRQVQSQWLTYKSSLQEAMKEGRVAHLIEGSDALVAPMEKAVAMLQEESEERVTLLLWSQTIGVLAGLVLVAVVMVMMQKGLVGPLEALKAYARSVSEGDLKAAVTGQFTAELGALKESIERMVEGLGRSMEAARRKEVQAAESEAEARAALEKAKAEEARSAGLLSRMTTAAATARGVSERVSSETANLLDQVGHVSRGADLQRDRMTETATAMEEMNATVLEVARNAAHAAESAEQAKDRAATGAAGVRSAVSSIENIRQRIIALKESMARLGQQADSIGNIMNVISDIADQTNLLALNAAIEAARAGDAGRGFAVVADEVRKLAEKTMTATKEVGDAVQSIQNQARENIEAVEGAASGIEDSTRAAEESGRFMDEIVGIIDDTATQVLSIATASEEQSAASEEINRAVEEVSSIAHDTAQDMAGASRGLEMLTNLARELDGVIRDMGDESGGEGVANRLAALDSEVARSRAAATPVRERASLPAASRPANGGGILQWDDSLSVNVAEIDEQHKELVRMINEMHEAMRTGKGKKAIGDILTRLENYTVNHFSMEERYMQKYNYPGYPSHKKEHEALVGKVMDFDKEFRSGRAALSTEIMNFLKNWLVRHIKGTDKKYSAFFNQRGLH